jgi:hypothetical protein
MRQIFPVLLLILLLTSVGHAYASFSPYMFGFNAGYAYKTADACHSVSLKEYDNCLMGYSAGENLEYPNSERENS